MRRRRCWLWRRLSAAFVAVRVRYSALPSGVRWRRRRRAEIFRFVSQPLAVSVVAFRVHDLYATSAPLRLAYSGIEEQDACCACQCGQRNHPVPWFQRFASRMDAGPHESAHARMLSFVFLQTILNMLSLQYVARKKIDAVPRLLNRNVVSPEHLEHARLELHGHPKGFPIINYCIVTPENYRGPTLDTCTSGGFFFSGDFFQNNIHRVAPDASSSALKTSIGLSAGLNTDSTVFTICVCSIVSACCLCNPFNKAHTPWTLSGWKPQPKWHCIWAPSKIGSAQCRCGPSRPARREPCPGCTRTRGMASHLT